MYPAEPQLACDVGIVIGRPVCRTVNASVKDQPLLHPLHLALDYLICMGCHATGAE